MQFFPIVKLFPLLLEQPRTAQVLLDFLDVIVKVNFSLKVKLDAHLPTAKGGGTIEIVNYFYTFGT